MLVGKIVGEGEQPLVCTPLVAKTQETILAELNNILEKNPDMIEWRADYFEDITDLAKVVSVARQIVENKNGIPVIFTLRSKREGGYFVPNSPEEALHIIAAACNEGGVAYVDYELGNSPEQLRKLRQLIKGTNAKIIASFHDFTMTPDKETLLSKLGDAEKYGADVAKIAVMPNSLEDVLTVLAVTLEAQKIIGIPVITVAMGPIGVATRLLGGIFGSAVTFAVGHESSAPGQIPIEELKTVLTIVQKSMSGK